MLVWLFILSFLSTTLILMSSELGQYQSLRDIFVKTSIIYGVLIVGLTEGLSLNRLLEINFVAAFWVLILVLNIVLIVLSLNQRSLQISHAKTIQLKSLNLDDSISRFTVFLVLLITLITALIAAPNNWDAMTYHLPRVMHWLQNQTVAHYPTSNLRQISLAPGAGYLVAQLQILSGSDRFANCIQWLALLGSTLATSLITEKLVSKGSKWLSMLVCISMPMAIMQATTSQTDLLLTYWLLCLTYFIFKANTYRISDYCLISASLGLSILTKPTAFLFNFPLVAIFILRGLTQDQLKHQPSLKKVITVTAMILIALMAGMSLSIPSYWRNYLSFGSFMGPDFNTKNDLLGISQLLSNLLKNLAINLPIPGFWQLIDIVHHSILKVDINDPRLNYAATPLAGDASHIHLAILKVLAPHEDYVGSPVHLLLIGLGWIGLGLSYRRFQQNLKQNSKILNLSALSIATLLSFLSFCLLLKWQVWGNRLLLPLFGLNVPLMTYALQRVMLPRLRRALIMLLAVLAILYALTPMRHPLMALPTGSDEQSASILSLPRSRVYFSGVHKDLEVPYKAAIAAIQPCRSVGLALGGDDWEYPLWILMREQNGSSFQMKHVNVRNESQLAQPEFADEQVCAVISTVPTYDPTWKINQNLVWREQVIAQAPFLKIFVLETQQTR